MGKKKNCPVIGIMESYIQYIKKEMNKTVRIIEKYYALEYNVQNISSSYK
jgi:hypothetical protein